MAQIKTNLLYGTTGNLPAVSGANLTNLDASDLTGALPAISGASLTNLPGGGKVLQVTSNVVTASTSNTSHSSYVASDLLGTITPSATSSHILVLINGRFHIYEDSTASNGGMRGRAQVHRDINGGGFSAAFPATTDITAGVSGLASGAEGTFWHHLHYSFRDSPNTTDLVTYKPYHRLDVASGYGTSSNIGGSSAHMSVVLMEIDGS